MDKNQVLFVSQSLAPLRAADSESSEMVSQLLFGERVQLLEQKANWARVRCLHDGYEGWSDFRLYSALPAEWENASLWRRIHTPWLKATRQTGEYEVPLSLTLGCLVPVKGGTCRIGAENFDFGAADLTARNEATGESVMETALRYHGAPYLWGGRSLWGIDCSGLVQMAFAFAGKNLPRDAWQQALQGDEIPLGKAEPGDLAFFHRESDAKIVHVGFCDGNGGILHASGSVRKDYLAPEGIHHSGSGLLTHRLSFVKRIT